MVALKYIALLDSKTALKLPKYKYSIKGNIRSITQPVIKAKIEQEINKNLFLYQYLK